MNCKPGDLAYTVRPWREPGRIVSVVRDAGCWNFISSSGSPYTEQVWLCHGDLGAGLREGFICDSSIRPIRPDGITDEEVRDLYLSKPVKEVA